MLPLLIFSIALLISVLVSELASRSVLSTAVLFLLAGWLAGNGGLGLLSVTPTSPIVSQLANIALFSILFTDGMRVGLSDLTKAWHLPGRALLFGLPFTLGGTALAAHWLAGLPWTESLLLGAALSPTDPVFAAAIVGRREIPQRLRHLLNVESGVNDGLALPFVVSLLAILSADAQHPLALAAEVLGGISLGIIVPWLALRIQSCRIFAIHESHRSLFILSIGFLLFAITGLTHANSYLAAFTAGITIATLRPKVRTSFHPVAEPLTELMKLAALLVFGALLDPTIISDLGWWDVAFMLIALIAVRPIALFLSLFGSPLSKEELLVAGWFGPKGFASVVYGLLILQSGVPGAVHLFHLIAFVIAASIIMHSSTDVLIAQWFARRANRSSSEPITPHD